MHEMCDSGWLNIVLRVMPDQLQPWWDNFHLDVLDDRNQFTPGTQQPWTDSSTHSSGDCQALLIPCVIQEAPQVTDVAAGRVVPAPHMGEAGIQVSLEGTRQSRPHSSRRPTEPPAPAASRPGAAARPGSAEHSGAHPHDARQPEQRQYVSINRFAIMVRAV